MTGYNYYYEYKYIILLWFISKQTVTEHTYTRHTHIKRSLSGPTIKNNKPKNTTRWHKLVWQAKPISNIYWVVKNDAVFIKTNTNNKGQSQATVRIIYYVLIPVQLAQTTENSTSIYPFSLSFTARENKHPTAKRAYIYHQYNQNKHIELILRLLRRQRIRCRIYFWLSLRK